MPARTLPTELQPELEPLFEAIPLQQSMAGLVTGFTESRHADLAQKVLAAARLEDRRDLAAGVWLYVDDLERAHRVCQDDSSQTGSMWHAIVHRREGDFTNSGYWLRRAGQHPAFAGLLDYSAGAFLAEVEQRHVNNPSDLVEMQRQEWLALFTWCASQGASNGG